MEFKLDQYHIYSSLYKHISKNLIRCYENEILLDISISRRPSSDIYKDDIVRWGICFVQTVLICIHYSLCIINMGNRNIWNAISYSEFYEMILQKISHCWQMISFDNARNSWSSNRDKFTVTALSLTLFEIQAVYKAVTEFNKFYDLSDNSQSSLTISSLL